ncbi:hypothetical protein Tco_0924129 [Tanacetum coccineum]|uniref:MAK10-like protein n=1 Tax=Tanacetum coccineum TaxID=301880 RepID=A0ABQ5D2Y9_9ASTR
MRNKVEVVLCFLDNFEAAVRDEKRNDRNVGHANPIRTLGDYSRPSHEGYRNIIELPEGSNVDLLQKVPHHGIDLWLQVQIFYDHVNPATRRTIDQSAGGKLRDRNAKESWALLEDLALYDNKSWNDPRDFAKPVKAISLPQDVPNTSDRHLIELKNQVQRLMEAHLAPKQPVQVNTITSSCEICMEQNHLAHRQSGSLPVIKVLAHAPMYNAILDKYMESLELGKNGSAFVQGEVSTKMEDPGLFTLPCRLGDSKPFDTLADLG